MEFKLSFELTLIDGTVVNQEYGVPPEAAKVQAMINQLFAMYMQLGYVKEVDGFLTVTRVQKIRVAVPSILIAKPEDVPSSKLILS